MKIEHYIEKIEDMYFNVQLTFKSREMESKIIFSLVDDNIEKFITFINKIHSIFINTEFIPYNVLNIQDENDIVISYIKKDMEDTITIANNNVIFYFKNIAKILLTFMEMSEYLQCKTSEK